VTSGGGGAAGDMAIGATAGLVLLKPDDAGRAP